MSHTEPQGHVTPDAAAGHEPSEIQPRPILAFGAVLIGISIAAMVGLAALMRGFAADEKAEGTSTRTLVEEKPGDFPDPRLQHDTDFDMRRFREAEAAALGSYGWVDRKAGIAQIPIESAMDLIAKHGLPRPKSAEAGKKE